MANFCYNCGRPVADGARFCTNCGAALQPEQPVSQQPVTQQQPQPQPTYQQPAYQPPQPPKKPIGTGKLTTSIICLLLSAAILVTSFWKPGFLIRVPDDAGKVAAGEASGPIATSAPVAGTDRSELTAYADSPTVTAGSGVTVELSPFLFTYDQPLTVTVADAGVFPAENGDWQITAYDVGIGSEHELDTFIDIRLPFDDSFCEPGEDPAQCVGAKYYNETSGEWEDVLFDVDAAAREVVIHTDHLSYYGCFQVKNAGMRKAYVTDVSDLYIGDIPLTKAAKAMANYAQAGIHGDSVMELGMEVYNRVIQQALADVGAVADASDVVVNSYNGLQLSDLKFFSEGMNNTNSAISKTIGNLGKLASAVKLGLEIMKTGKTDEDIINIYKDGGMFALSFAEGALGTAMAGVWVIDKAITDLGKAARDIRMENWESIYVYYNDSYIDKVPGHDGAHRARTSREWRDLMGKLVTVSHGNQETFETLLEAQVDAYARRFFANYPHFPEEDIEEIQHIVDHQWKGALSASEMEQLISKYKQNLYQRLTSIIMVSLQKDSQRKVEAEFLEALQAVKVELNQKSMIRIYEVLEEGQTPQLGGYTMRFAPLSTDADLRDWSGVMPEDGEATATATVIGWLIAGHPSRVDFWAPGKDPDQNKPKFSVDFQFNAPRCEVPVQVSLFPTLDELAGFYANGTVTLTDIVYPSEEVHQQMIKDGCDYDDALGQVNEFQFSMVKVSDTAGYLNGKTGRNSELNVGDPGVGLDYDPRTGVFEPYIMADKTTKVVFTMTAVYTDNAHSGVLIGCTMEGTDLDNGTRFTAIIQGEKALESNAS